eukprot:gnl/MRDRNA2_/MRDRNA2_37816_c0_seq1.p1 gnl/MRDRNA2_/MRDRNA2_37816_c0~~gnl/MRDRNA2_/MRDRNA2_37816_c0_seq1.p1  ORF type:complete len:453 (-),score=65.49 gnl/MRDRNA2_/MRDRNA2_37816_c0_seq1:25-1383(-)
MLYFYPITCGVALVVCAVLGFLTRPKADPSVGMTEGFRQFQIKYLLAWSVCVAADWLQGPYVYALYEAYGYSREQNAQLFVAGFGASFIFGTFVAGFADSIGRKRAVLLYCLLYIVSCMTKHVNAYPVLMLGRVTGGIATSLLFSAFESWLVSEHNVRHGFNSQLLGYNFSMMYFVNYLVAVCTGLVGDSFVDAIKMTPIFSQFHIGGFLMPFDVAIVCLLIGGTYIATNWEENYGDAEDAVKAVKNFGTGAMMIATNAKMALTCGVIALFESSMYIFVFNWTPVLKQGPEVPPFGMIFATFMMSCMIGASICALCSSVQTKKMLFVACVLAATVMIMPAHVGMSESLSMYNLWALCCFELCVGIYFPSICTLKSEAVPETHRATVYNLFRAPMNLIVVSVLLINPDLMPTFQLVSSMLLLAGVLMGVMLTLPESAEKGETTPLAAEAAKEV